MTRNYAIWIEAEQWMPGGWTPADDNSDVIVTFDDGESWVATFFSYQNVYSLAARNRQNGESLGGTYLASSDMILVDEVTRARIEEVVADLIAREEFCASFRRSGRPRREDTYLGTIDEVVGGLDDDRAPRQIGVLASMLGKLGYELRSGPSPHFHELWAAALPRRVPSELSQPAALSAQDGRELMAEGFERQFLAWLHVTFGILPVPRQATDASWWSVRFRQTDVSFVIIGLTKNTAAPPAPDERWLLRIEEAEPTAFTQIVEGYFLTGSAVRRRMPNGRIRAQFKASALVRPFIDQTDLT